MSDPREPPGRAAQITHLNLGGVRALLIDLPVDTLELPESLTESECEVVRLVAQGLSNEEVARARGSRPRTVANQLAAVYRKLGVFSRTELLARLNGTAD
ncbi:MAG: helix-turn-helix transcriptional regulator [Myxococcaceae bacterium]|nr:helix-turn-helix transcriptional regulator [Myxococcaceae bacterium]